MASLDQEMDCKGGCVVKLNVDLNINVNGNANMQTNVSVDAHNHGGC